MRRWFVSIVVLLALAGLAALADSMLSANTSGTSPEHAQSALRTPTSHSVGVPREDRTNRHASTTSNWKLVYSTHFTTAVPLGSFSGCDTSNDTCTGLPAPVRSQWWAYPNPWPDTATQRGYPVGGYYNPSKTIWISGGEMHIRMFRQAGAVNSAAVLPRAAMNRKYGEYIETFRVSKVTTGYKSAYMLWPAGNADFEVDYPENEWNTPISAHVHYGAGDNELTFKTGVEWNAWHTTEIVWTPSHLAFYMDGKRVGYTTKGVPDVTMNWIIQNESALNGEQAPENSWAQIDISQVAYYSYVP